MRLIDLDQTVFVPLVDESKGGVKYEVEMTIAEVFDKFFDGFQPEIIDAIPVEWLRRKMKTPIMTCANPFDYVFCEWINREVEHE